MKNVKLSKMKGLNISKQRRRYLPPCCSRFDKGSISSSGGDLFNELSELIGNSNRSLLESS